MSTAEKIEKRMYRVGGTHCAGCAAAVEKTLNAIGGVEASVSLPAEAATLSFTRDVPLEQIVAAVEKAGYQIEPAPEVDRAAAEKDRLREAEERAGRAMRRMWTAWALAGPVMIWMIPEMVFGLRWPSALVFDLGMTAFGALVLVWPGNETLKSAWRCAGEIDPDGIRERFENHDPRLGKDADERMPGRPVGSVPKQRHGIDRALGDAHRPQHLRGHGVDIHRLRREEMRARGGLQHIIHLTYHVG